MFTMYIQLCRSLIHWWNELSRTDTNKLSRRQYQLTSIVIILSSTMTSSTIHLDYHEDVIRNHGLWWWKYITRIIMNYWLSLIINQTTTNLFLLRSTIEEWFSKNAHYYLSLSKIIIFHLFPILFTIFQLQTQAGESQNGLETFHFLAKSFYIHIHLYFSLGVLNNNVHRWDCVWHTITRQANKQTNDSMNVRASNDKNKDWQPDWSIDKCTCGFRPSSCMYMRLGIEVTTSTFKLMWWISQWLNRWWTKRQSMFVFEMETTMIDIVCKM